MAINFDLNKIRYITRGEVSGSARFFALVMCAIGTWIGASWFSSMAKSAASSLTLSQTRYYELNQLAAEYKNLAPNSRQNGNQNGEIDVMAAFTQVSEKIELGSRISRISPTPDGTRCFVEVNRVYAEELEKMVRELAIRGIIVISAELFTIPVGDERLFRLNMTIGSEA